MIEHEATMIGSRVGGHAIAKHIGQSQAALRAWLAAERGIPAASTFKNIDVAERVIYQAIRANRAIIESWARLVRQGQTTRAFQPFVGAPEPLLQEVQPQHQCYPARRTTALVAIALALQCVVRFNQRLQSRERHHTRHLVKKTLAPHDACLAVKLGVGEADLFRLPWTATLSVGSRGGVDQCFLSVSQKCFERFSNVSVQF